MTKVPVMSIYVKKNEFSDVDFSEFLQMVNMYMDCETVTQKSMADEWAILVAFMKNVGIVSGGGLAVIKFVQEIIKIKEKYGNKNNAIVLKRPDKPDLVLSEATAKEIELWFDVKEVKKELGSD